MCVLFRNEINIKAEHLDKGALQVSFSKKQ